MRHWAVRHPFVYGILRQRPALRLGKVSGADEWITDCSLKSRLAAATLARELHVLIKQSRCHVLTLRGNGKTLKLWFFAIIKVCIITKSHSKKYVSKVCIIKYVIKVCKKYITKKGRMIKPLMPKFSPDLSVGLRNIAKKKTGPREAETDNVEIRPKRGHRWKMYERRSTHVLLVIRDLECGWRGSQSLGWQSFLDLARGRVEVRLD